MAEGLSNVVKHGWLDALCNATAYSEAGVYVQLHTADPGAAGTTSIAGETDRTLVSFALASAGAITSDADATWTSVAANETYSWISMWDASTSGNWLGNIQLTASKTVNIGDNFTIPTGDFDISIT